MPDEKGALDAAADKQEGQKSGGDQSAPTGSTKSVSQEKGMKGDRQSKKQKDAAVDSSNSLELSDDYLDTLA